MVIIKTKYEIEIIKRGGHILANIMEKIIAEVKPEITTAYLEDLACRLIKEVGGRPSFKGYKIKEDRSSFPTALCVSINDEVVHTPALPSRQLKEGDIVGIDVGMEWPCGKSPQPSFNKRGNKKGYYTDMAMTVPVGEINMEAEKLINVTKKSLDRAIRQVKPGNSLDDIAAAIQDFVEANGFSVVRDLVGHGVGYEVHEDPQIPNYVFEGKKFNPESSGLILKPGMVLAIEPMVNIGHWGIKNMPDGFTIKTADGSLSAHFEHTVVVTESGCEIATKL